MRNPAKLRTGWAALGALCLAQSAFGQFVEVAPDPHQRSVSVWDVLDAGKQDHEFTVYYRGEDLRPRFFDNRDLRVEGVGFEGPVGFVDASPITQGEVIVGYAVSYRVPAPPDGWSNAHNGPVTVYLQPKQVFTTDGPLEAGSLGQFLVRLGETPPLPKSASLSTITSLPGTVVCSPDETPRDCHAVQRVTVEASTDEGTYISNFHQPVLEGKTWVVDLRVSFRGAYPLAPAWHPIWQAVDWAGPQYPRSSTYAFRPPPGDYGFEVRVQGTRLAQRTFSVPQVAKVAVSPSPAITRAGRQDQLVTIRYWHPEGIDLASLGEDDLDISKEYSPARHPLGNPVEFIQATTEASGWTAASYRVSSPSDGWSKEDNGTFGLWMRRGAVRARSGVSLEPTEGPMGSFDVLIPTQAWVVAGPIRAYTQTELLVYPGYPHRKVTVHYESDERINLASIDSLDLSADGGGVLLRSANASDDGRQVVAGYELPGLPEFAWQAAEGAVMPLSLKAKQIATVSGGTNPERVELARITKREVNQLGIVPLFPGLLSSSAGFYPLRFYVRYASRSPIKAPQDARVDVIAAWLPNASYEGVPPIPFRQTARVVGSHSLDGGKSLTVNYELPAPPLGWTSLVNGPLEVEIASRLENEAGQSIYPGQRIGSLWINVAPVEVKTSLSIVEANQRILGQVKITTSHREGPQFVTDWRGPSVDGQRIYLDAYVNLVDCECEGDTFVFDREFTLFDLSLPLTATAFEPYEVILRVNGQPVARDTFTAKAPSSLAIRPRDVMFELQSGTDHTSYLRVRVTLSFPDVARQSLVVVNWGRLVAHGPNLVIEGAEFRVADKPLPGKTELRQDYRLDNFQPGNYRLEFTANGQPIAQMFWLVPKDPANGFNRWLRSAIIDRDLPTMITETARHPMGDLDQDGASDFAEYAFGTDPLDADSLPEFEPVAVRTGARGIGYLRREGGDVRYRLEQSTDLKNWRIVPDAQIPLSAQPVMADGRVGETILLPAGAKGQVFLRVRVDSL